jgi:hypothetical protein
MIQEAPGPNDRELLRLNVSAGSASTECQAGSKGPGKGKFK